MKRVATLLLALAPLLAAAEMPRFRWENFTVANGLPDNHVFNVAVDGAKIWAATENGLGLYQNGKWRTFTVADGLVHRVVTYVAPDKETGDIWIATMGGLSRFASGRFDQLHPAQQRPAQRCGLRRRRAERLRVGGHGRGRRAPRISAPANGVSSTNATRPCTRSGPTL